MYLPIFLSSEKINFRKLNLYPLSDEWYWIIQMGPAEQKHSLALHLITEKIHFRKTCV